MPRKIRLVSDEDERLRRIGAAAVPIAHELRGLVKLAETMLPFAVILAVKEQLKTFSDLLYPYQPTAVFIEERNRRACDAFDASIAAKPEEEA